MIIVQDSKPWAYEHNGAAYEIKRKGAVRFFAITERDAKTATDLFNAAEEMADDAATKH